MTSKLTIEQAKRLRNDFECWQQDCDPKDDKEQYDMFGRGMAAMDMLIAGMYQEPVAWTDAEELSDLKRDGYAAMLSLARNDCEHADPRRQILLFTYPAPESELKAIVERLNASGYEYEGGEITPQNVAAVVDILLQQLDDAVQGRNVQPEPILNGEPVAYAVSNDFWNQGNHKQHIDGKQCDLFFPGDIYRGEQFKPDDYDHAFPLYRHAQQPVVPDDVLDALQKVARIRLDMNDFDGDRRGIADCLGDAEEALIEVVNRRAAMLQAGALTNEDIKFQATKFKPVADLYGITSPTGSETSFTFDAGEASSFAKGGWTVQEYVELERYQEAMTGNSPVIPDGWIPVSERMPEMGEQQCYVLAADFKNNYFPNTPNTQVGVYGDWFNDGNPTWDDGDGEDLHLKEVTHWMPLPNPPQEPKP